MISHKLFHLSGSNAVGIFKPGSYVNTGHITVIVRRNMRNANDPSQTNMGRPLKSSFSSGGPEKCLSVKSSKNPKDLFENRSINSS